MEKKLHLSWDVRTRGTFPGNYHHTTAATAWLTVWVGLTSEAGCSYTGPEAHTSGLC